MSYMGTRLLGMMRVSEEEARGCGQSVQGGGGGCTQGGGPTHRLHIGGAWGVDP